MFRNSQNTVLSCVYQALSLVSIGYEKIQRFEARDYSECAIRIALCLGAPSVRTSNHRSLRSSLFTVPYSRKIQWHFKISTDLSVRMRTNQSLLFY